MEGAKAWQYLFENWPEQLPRTGQIVTAYADTIKFIDFLLTDGIVFVERDRPDATGARKVMIAYDAIQAVKLESAVELEKFKILGFR
jgi:hypothetical protein